MSDFFDSLSDPDYASSYNALRNQDKSMGFIYVEDNSDIVFWDTFVKKGLSKRYELMTASQGETGKRALEKMYDKANPMVLIAVDSDYDYIDSKFNQDHPFNTNRYILHTFVFTRESALIEQNSLQEFFHRCRHTQSHNIDIVNFLAEFSQLAWHGLVKFITAKYCDNYQSYTEEEFKKCFHLTDKRLINDSELTLNIAELQTVKSNIDKLFSSQQFTDRDLLNIETKLHELDISQDNAYRFIDGHTLEYLVKKVHKELTDVVRNIEIGVIRNDFTGKEIGERITQFDERTMSRFRIDTFFLNYPINEDDEIHQKILSRIKNIPKVALQ